MPPLPAVCVLPTFPTRTALPNMDQPRTDIDGQVQKIIEDCLGSPEADTCEGRLDESHLHC